MPPRNQSIGVIFVGVAIFFCTLAFVFFRAASNRGTSPTPPAQLDAALRTVATTQPRQEGIALAILLDTSGSMNSAVPDADGSRKRKLDIARRCLVAVVRQAEGFAREQPDQATRVGIYEFSNRGNTSCRQVIPLSSPNVAAAENAMASLVSDGGTPIGEAMIQAKRDLDASRLSRTHLLIITDGENTSGVDPGEVMTALGRLPAEQRPGVYFIAFDVAAAAFNEARSAGALVLPAANEKELQKALDELVGNKILLEQ